MKLILTGIPKEQEKTVHLAIKTVDALVWGGQINKKVKTLKIFKDSNGNPEDPPIFKGLMSVYDHKTKTCELHIKSLIEMGQDNDGNLFWSICHDLAHAFDVCFNNLRFNKEAKTITYLGKTYNFEKPANTYIPPEYGRLNNFRKNLYYQAHDLYEPWEVRPLFAADACAAENRRGLNCPNLIGDG
jgi:hypothetical protein